MLSLANQIQQIIKIWTQFQQTNSMKRAYAVRYNQARVILLVTNYSLSSAECNKTEEYSFSGKSLS